MRPARVESFAVRPRFAKERFWHVEIEFKSPQSGPLVIGDGRYLGLGLMAPQAQTIGVMAFAIEPGALSVTLTRALRRAVLAAVQDSRGNGASPHFTLGVAMKLAHERAPARMLGVRLRRTRTLPLIIAPHDLERRAPRRDELSHRTQSRRHWQT